VFESALASAAAFLAAAMAAVAASLVFLTAASFSY
jgi:hypothetical protein